MLTTEDLLKNMKKHFPRWMDIRRKTSSSGSILLESIADETSNISNAIDEYKKDFFLDKYMNNEDSILTFIYKATVGSIEQEKIVLINPDIEIVIDQETFYSKDNVCLYLDGIMYFKENYEEVQYAIEGYKSYTSLKKMHVWNVFDEFAVFVGLRRYQWETNKELLNRILSKSNKTINSSENGLKESLLMNLVNIAPELSKEDILIERPTPENLMNYYNEFENILDHLNSINRDVYKNKKWDIDTWNFSIKSVDYIPHAWDVVLDSYINGVGDNDDLKVEIIDDTTTTDATLSFYKKSKTVVNSYVRNNNIKEKLKLTLRKYNTYNKSCNVNYKITASEAKLIEPEQIIIGVNKEKTGSFKVPISSITIYPYGDKNNLFLDRDCLYKLRFTPIDKTKDFRIDKLSINRLNNEINSIQEQPGFKFTDYGKKSVRYEGTLKYITDEFQCSELQNVYKTCDGFEINDLSKKSKMAININGCANEHVFYEYDIKQVPLLFNNIIKTNCYIKDGYIVPDISDKEKYISIDTDINSLSMTIEGPYSIEYSLGNSEIKSISDFVNDKFEFTIDKFNISKNIKLKVKLYDTNKSKISNIMYSKYNLNISTKYGDFNNEDTGSILSSNDINQLEITMQTYTGFSPIIKYIYIGKPIPEDVYYEVTLDPGNYYSSNYLNVIFENCKMKFSKIRKSDNVIIEEFEDYHPVEYYGLSADQNLQLDELEKKFSAIEEITADGCVVEKNNSDYFLHATENIRIAYINIKGTFIDDSYSTTLEEIIRRKVDVETYDDYSFYAFNNYHKLIGVDNKTKKLICIEISSSDIFEKYSASSVKITYKPYSFYNAMSDMLVNFVEKDSSNQKIKTVTNASESNRYFDYISFASTSIDEDYSVAINSSITYSIYNSSFHKIIDTFTKEYHNYNTPQILYTVESLNEDYNVTFCNHNLHENPDQYDVIFDGISMSFGENYVQITKKQIDIEDYNYDEITIEEDFKLGTCIELPSKFISKNKEEIILDEYVIENYDNINYSTKDDSDNPLDFLKSEEIYIGDQLEKLKYSNIHEIESILTYKNGSTIPLIEGVDFEILLDVGLIIWKKSLARFSQVNIRYYIKKAVSMELDIDSIYNIIKYNVNSLELIDQIKLEKISIDQQIDLSLYEVYSDSDITSIHCDEPGFIANTTNDIIKFSTTIENNTVAVRSGFYYMDGNEYYMFADNNLENIEKIDNVYMKNVFKENKAFSLKQQTTNFITNSSMKLNTTGEIFDLNCNDKEIETVSKLNSITACENFNYWSSIASNLSIAEGVNGQGIHFTSMNNTNGYIYIPISNLLTKECAYILSFYLSGKNPEAYIGKERIIYSTNSKFNQESVIDITSTIKESNIEKNIFEIEFEHNEESNYFLIISNTGIIDDVIIVEKSDYEQGMHKKNIDYLNLNIEEHIYAEYNTRLYLSEEDGSIFDGTEIKDNTIINSSYIQWGFTNIKKIDSYEELKKCTLTNVDLDQYNNKCIAKTGVQSGTIVTNPIYIGNVKTIKNLLFKINNVMFNNMKGFKVKVLTSNNVSSGFKEISQHIDNIVCISGDKLLSYVKLMVEMPSNKVITNIDMFVEYLSDEMHTPASMSVLSGVYISKVLDAQYNDRFLVKNINLSDNNNNIENYIFQVRASKQNDEKTTWTDWKTIELKEYFNDTVNVDIMKNGNVSNRLVFDGYRFFQFKLILKGENSSIKINYMDLEVL